MHLHDFADNHAKKFGRGIKCGTLDIVAHNHPKGGMTVSSISLRALDTNYPLPDDVAAIQSGKMPAQLATKSYSELAINSEKYCGTTSEATTFDRYAEARPVVNAVYTKELLDVEAYTHRQLNPSSKEAGIFLKGGMYIEQKLGMKNLTPKQRSVKLYFAVKEGTLRDVPVERLRTGANGLGHHGLSDLTFGNTPKVTLDKSTFKIPPSNFKG